MHACSEHCVAIHHWQIPNQIGELMARAERKDKCTVMGVLLGRAWECKFPHKCTTLYRRVESKRGLGRKMALNLLGVAQNRLHA